SGRRRCLGASPAAALATLLALVLVAGTGAAPAAALRSGPDVALRSGPGGPLFSAPGGPLFSGAGARADVGAGVRTGTVAGAVHPGATGYVPPVPGVDPPSGVERGFDPPEEEWGAGHRGVDLTAAEGSP